jgi:Yip1 domain
MNVVLRVRALLVDPAAEWQRIEKETGDPAFLLSRYVAILALIPALCGFIGSSIIGADLPGAGTVRAPAFDGLFSAIVGYVAAFIAVLLLALIIELLAPLFGGQRNFGSALKLAVYSYTPLWLAGIFLVLPGLRFLMLTGFYGVYVLATGLSRLMKSSEQRAAAYVFAIAACACALTYAQAVAQRAMFGAPGF